MLTGWRDGLVLVPVVAMTCGSVRSSSVNVSQRWSASDGLDTAWDGLMTAWLGRVLSGTRLDSVRIKPEALYHVP